MEERTIPPFGENEVLNSERSNSFRRKLQISEPVFVSNILKLPVPELAPINLPSGEKKTLTTKPSASFFTLLFQLHTFSRK
ncbi:MAG: hypothetical protein CL678_03755 [Bdellovibrionaceae bacterium]|nr:hypothetical protein [Pseudobdellovibrionaceae bacterium]|tara:strand:- start:443 stop:685 length:243 start_codon:yes stop_codon:yes gene_type:complete